MKTLNIIYRVGRYDKFKPVTIQVPEDFKPTTENLLKEARKIEPKATEAKKNDRA